ncbi:hypothetical protein G6F62_011145 [Rhizopus arrhizus]|nr:hypothetical protein G6F62_011145 [Rhizopus arrhizus]
MSLVTLFMTSITKSPKEDRETRLSSIHGKNPDTSMIRHKMVYASSKISLRKQMDGVGIEIQGTDASEVDYESVLEKAQRSA